MLVIDIGNTSISYALFKEDQPLEPYTIPLNKHYILKKYNKIKDKVIVSSVVPHIDKKIYSYFKRKPIFITNKNIPLIKIKTKNPSEVGADRLVNAYAAVKEYECPIVVIDFGTATTFDVISPKKEYLGGLICPGLELSRQMLAQKTAKLPLISLKTPKKIIGQTTEESMLSGLIFGYQEMIKGLLSRIKKQLSKKTLVCATGGYSRLICENLNEINIINPTLTLEGLVLLGKEIK